MTSLFAAGACKRLLRVCVGCLGAVVLIAATWSLNPVYGSEDLATTSAQGGGCEWLHEQLTASHEALVERSSELQERLQAVATSLQDLEDAGESIPTAKLAEQKDTLTTERAALQNELKFLESAHTAWQAALDACENAARLRHELAQFEAGGQPRAEDFVASDVTALQAQLDQIQSASAAQEEPEDVRTSRLAQLAELIETADEQARHVHELERVAVRAQAESARQKRAVHDAERDLLEAKLAAAREAVGEASAVQATSPTKAPEADEADALNKERLAQQLDAEARNRLDFAQSRLDEIEERLARASAEDHDTAGFENDLEFWRRVETYEQRRLQQAELHKRSAQQKEVIGQLRQRIAEANTSLEELGEKRSQMTRQQHQERATGFKKQADAMLKEADTLHEEAIAEEKEIEPLQQLLPGIDAIENALRERLDQAGDLHDYQRLSSHFRRMKQQYDTERQQIDLVVVTRENIVYAKMRQATLTRGLADLYVQCADVLVPPEQSFWDRHRKIIHSIGILAAVIAASYAVRLLIWVIRRALSGLNALTNRRLSVKRIGTLLSFAGSILKLFVWVFGTVAILNEFGIEPSKSTGPIALVGLIMAGMFQQIVVDFVKGLDIIAGRHYNVGDFVEVDGKHGHVVDFNVKYTRIRSLSGQEFNIPNSRCVPSRRFPDGFVSNYVDIRLKSPADEDRAKTAIGAVCSDLNQRIEPVRDEPILAQCFHGGHDSVTLRYRVRVLPGCDWVVRDHFIPAVKEAMTKEEVELAGEPTFSFINRIDTFRKLFSRRLSEEQIVREVAQSQSDPVADEDGAQQPTPGPHPG